MTWPIYRLLQEIWSIVYIWIVLCFLLYHPKCMFSNDFHSKCLFQVRDAFTTVITQGNLRIYKWLWCSWNIGWVSYTKHLYFNHTQKLLQDQGIQETLHLILNSCVDTPPSCCCLRSVCFARSWIRGSVFFSELNKYFSGLRKRYVG